MLDFDAKIYRTILNWGDKNNLLANCREYPSLTCGGQSLDFKTVRQNLIKKFNDPGFACGLYVHFPFCRSRCGFCKYYSEIFRDGSIFDRYLFFLEKELRSYRLDFSRVQLDNFYLGGGTPTLLHERQIAKCLDLVYRFFRFRRGAQINIEGTPESITLSKARTYKNLGINRISLGVQSMNDEVLRKNGRRHDVKDVFKAFAAIRKAGIKYIAADILWGLPEESEKTYRRTLERTIELSPEFIECFLLTTGGRVKINRSYFSGEAIDRVINSYKDKLLSNDYRLYAAGNFLGVTKRGISHAKAANQNTDGLYNYRAHVFGIGPGASSHFKNLKYKIVSDFSTYADFLSRNSFPPVYGLKISRDDYKRQYVLSRVGFFRSVEKDAYRRIFARELADDFPREISYLRNAGIIRETGNLYKWVLDERGMGHRAYFMHAIQYWYRPEYIRKIIENNK